MRKSAWATDSPFLTELPCGMMSSRKMSEVPLGEKEMDLVFFLGRRMPGAMESAREGIPRDRAARSPAMVRDVQFIIIGWDQDW